jgi:hypothetical protein
MVYKFQLARKVDGIIAFEDSARWYKLANGNENSRPLWRASAISF